MMCRCTYSQEILINFFFIATLSMRCKYMSSSFLMLLFKLQLSRFTHIVFMLFTKCSLIGYPGISGHTILTLA